jgi:transposase
VARRNGTSSSLLFGWRRLLEEGELESQGVDEQVRPLSEAKQLQARVRELERVLGNKTLEAEILTITSVPSGLLVIGLFYV